MVDFLRIIKPGILPAVPERFQMRGERTDLASGRKWSVRVVAEIKHENQVLKLVEGGVTGFESFVIDNSTLETISKGWCACFGTKGRWDQLYIDEENMTALVAWIREKML